MANEPGIMLTGDFVFVGDLGRSDLLDEAIVTHCQTCPRSAVVASMLGASGFEGVAELDGRRFRRDRRPLSDLSERRGVGLGEISRPLHGSVGAARSRPSP